MFFHPASAVCCLIATQKEGACGVCGSNSSRFNQHTINTHTGHLDTCRVQITHWQLLLVSLSTPVNGTILFIFTISQSARARLWGALVSDSACLGPFWLVTFSSGFGFVVYPLYPGSHCCVLASEDQMWVGSGKGGITKQKKYNNNNNCTFFWLCFILLLILFECFPAWSTTTICRHSVT